MGKLQDKTAFQRLRFTRRAIVGGALAAAVAVLLNGCRTSSNQENQPSSGVGAPAPATPEPTFIGDEENLEYNNPFGQQVDPSWYDGKKVYHFALNWSTERPPFNVAEQYLFVHEDEYGAPTTVEGFKTQPKVTGQFVVFDSVPGQPNYSPIWHNNWVLVSRDYQANSIRSLEGINKSGFRVIDSPFYIN